MTEIIEHEGVKYRKVERRAVEGDYVIITSLVSSDETYNPGEIYQVIRSGVVGVYIDDEHGSYAVSREFAVLEPLPAASTTHANATMQKLTDAKPGDTVRVVDVNDSEEIGYSNGDTFEVESVWDNLRGVSAKDNESSFGLYAEEFEVVREQKLFDELATSLEQAAQLAESYAADDLVNHPDHYNAGRFEVIDVIEDITKSAAAKGANGFETYMLGNVVKYIARYRHKNGAQDLRKAAWYLQRMIDEVEND